MNLMDAKYNANFVPRFLYFYCKHFKNVVFEMHLKLHGFIDNILVLECLFPSFWFKKKILTGG